MKYCVLFFLILLAFSERYSSSQTGTNVPSDIVISKLFNQINFDGVPDEDAWNTIEPIRMSMHSPFYGNEPSESTDVRFAYDDNYLYMGARLFYSDITMIRSSSYKRDYTGQGGDLFGFILDSYDDNENGIAFYTTPDGLRFDASIQRDAILTRPDQKPMNLSWNAFWDVQTRMDPRGWTVEMRVPFSSLRFQEINGEVRMGLIVRRWIPAKNEIDVYPAIPPNWGEYSTIKPSRAGTVIFRNVKPARPLQVAPYIMTGYCSNYDLNEESTSFWQWNERSIEPGIDVKYGISSNAIMDLTVNTDFAQVEDDDEKINLTRMALFFPEKRLFFLERSSIFDFNSGGNNNLFYSRRIGLSDDEEDPEPIRIYGGVKMTGRKKKMEMGFLDMQTAPLVKKTSSGQNHHILPSENFGVARFRRQVMNENSYIGAIFTSRLGVDGTYNVAYGFDGIFKVFGNDYLNLLWSQTFEDSVNNSSAIDPARFMIMWERRARKGLGYEIGYSQSGIHYNPGIGYEAIDDVGSFRGSMRYGWIPKKSRIYSHGPEFRVRYNRYIDDGSLMTWNPQFGWQMQTKGSWQGHFSLVYNGESLREPMEIIENELYIDSGIYRFANIRADVTTPQSKMFFTRLESESGQYFDGIRLSLRLEPTWNISKHMEIGGTYNIDNLKFPERKIEMTNHIVGLKALYMFNTRLSVNTFIQHNTADHDILTNIRIRYNPAEGNDLYIMFNEGRNTSLTRQDPYLPVYSSRALMIKYTYTFNL